jgi:ABC-type antimicrobial peptide transport system permease subunit
MALLEWNGSPLNHLSIDSKIRMDYFDPKVEGEGLLKTSDLTLRGYIRLEKAAQDRDLVPEILGVTDPRANLYDWDRPPVLPKEKIRKRVPDKPPHPRGTFFNTYKATPMAYMNLATAKRLFGSSYGSVTSMRIAPREGQTLEKAADLLRPVLLKHLNPKSSGFAFDPVRQRLLLASHGGTNFGGLFLGFSLFLIGASLLLVWLLFRLTLERRVKVIGLLLSAGYRLRTVRSLLLIEGIGLAMLGSLVGLAMSLAYNRLLLALLVHLWPDRNAAAFLQSHSSPMSFVLGFALTVLMALVALWLSIRGLVKIAPPALLRGEFLVEKPSIRSDARFSGRISAICLLCGVSLVIWGTFLSNPDYRALTFFAGGGMLLTAGLFAAHFWMKRRNHGIVDAHGGGTIGRLGVRNAARNPARSLLTIALIAAASFLLIAVESFRRQTGLSFSEKSGGSGGFNLIAECDVPLFQTFADPLGRRELETILRNQYGHIDSPRSDTNFAAAIKKLEGIEAYPLRLRNGDDASCLNLFQAARPKIVAVPDSLIERGGFQFGETEADGEAIRSNPWHLLRQSRVDGAIPVFCEQNTAEWMLKIAIGDEITINDDNGKALRLRLVGTLIDSPFQSELVMEEGDFTKAFTNTHGYRFFLIHTPAGSEAPIAQILTSAYRANGLVVTRSSDLVASYQAVIGAYLSTFQLLGGLGLLLGVLGLAVVILRGVWERIGELALLRAMGYRTRQLQFLILVENALLLVIGLAIGIFAALFSVAPHIAVDASVPWLRLGGILISVLALGLAVAFAATASILRVPLIPALRSE